MDGQFLVLMELNFSIEASQGNQGIMFPVNTVLYRAPIIETKSPAFQCCTISAITILLENFQMWKLEILLTRLKIFHVC